MTATYLVRYGTMGEVIRCAATDDGAIHAGAAVVIRTSRGEELGSVVAPEFSKPSEKLPAIVRKASASDLEAAERRRVDCTSEFPLWQRRIAEWELHLELIDLERTLDDEKLVLYVLNDRGPETTKLALRAAAAGFGVIEVQPVGAEGLIQASAGGGCGSGGCRH